MSVIRILSVVALVFCYLWHSPQLNAQQIGVSSPFTTFTNSYYEHMGINFGFQFPRAGGGFGGGSRIVGLMPNGQFAPNVSFNQNSAASAIPPFGGFDPGSAGSFGFGRVGSGGGGFSLGMNFGKGSSRMLTSTTPSMTMFNGMGGSMFHGEVRPFVTGVIPVVGNSGTIITHPVNAVTLATSSGQLDTRNLGREDISRSTSVGDAPLPRSSSAERAFDSVAEIKARKESESQATLNKIKEHLDEAASAVSNGEYPRARSFLKMAHDLMEDPSQRREIKSQIESLRGREKGVSQSDEGPANAAQNSKKD